MIDRLRTLWRKLFSPPPAPETVDMPSRILEGDAPRINDGLSYTLPPLLHGYQQDALAKSGKLGEWLTESARDTYRFQFDTPGRTAMDMQVMMPVEDPLREWSWATRQHVLSNTHAAYARNPIAKRAVHYVSAFVIGDGFNLTCKNTEVEDYLQAFIDNPDNAIREYERQAVIDLLVDGELFLRLFEEAGDVVCVPIRPWEVHYIHTEPQYYRRPLKYRIQPYTQYNIDDPENGDAVAPYDVPADQMMHVAINRHSYELRGRPELYAALPWLRSHKEWLENRARQNHWRGALLWWVKIASGLQSTIATKVAQYQRPPTPGSTVVTSDKEEWAALNNPVGAGDAGEDGRQLKIMALNAIAGIPEYMTGDGENANLATSKSQQLPVLKTFAEFQAIMIEQVWIPLFKRVLQAGIEASLLPEEVEEQDAEGEAVPDDPPEDKETPPAYDVKTGAINPATEPPKKTPPKKIKTIDAFEVQYEPVGDNEPFTMMQALDIAMNAGILSAQQATTEMGWDYALEQKRRQRERKKEAEAIARGEVPPPPGAVPPGFEDDEEAVPEKEPFA
jgi:hypothetical protein